MRSVVTQCIAAELFTYTVVHKLKYRESYRTTLCVIVFNKTVRIFSDHM